MNPGLGAGPFALTVRKGRTQSLERRHPWLFAGSLRNPPGNLPAGTVVELRTEDGAFLARGIYNDESQIVVRVLSFDPSEPIGPELIAARVQVAVARRRRLLENPDSDACRLVFGEADRLPGLVVDRYADYLVLQVTAAGLEPWRETVVEALVQSLRPAGIYERSDSEERRRHEGLGPRTGVLYGREPPEAVLIREAGIGFRVDLREGHKTGFYLDQRENRRLVGELAAGRRVLNAFAYTGGFGLHAAAGGANEVVHLDSSGPALALAEANADACPGDCRHVFRRDKVFEALREYRAAGESYDLIVLDPPKFAATRQQLDRARRGYHDLNVHAMRILRPGGLLATFSCSGAVDARLFREIVAGAAAEARREVLIRLVLGQPDDHPVLLGFPEGEYLKGLVVEVLS